MIKRSMIFAGVGLMVVGLLLMYFTKSMKYSIMYFAGISLAGVFIVLGLLKKRNKNRLMSNEPKPEAKNDNRDPEKEGMVNIYSRILTETANPSSESNPIEEFIDGKVLEVRKLIDRFLYLIECKKEIFKPGEAIRISRIKEAISSILHSENPFYPPVRSEPQVTVPYPPVRSEPQVTVPIEDPRDKISTQLIFEG